MRITLGPVMAGLLPAGLRRLLSLAGATANEQGIPAYLVGGPVRELALGRVNLDVDLVIEGNAIGLAETLVQQLSATLIEHHHFGTATLVLPWSTWEQVDTQPGPARSDQAGHNGLHVDLASTRTEMYSAPGALPQVQLGCDLATDLRRRDFTMNALAVALDPASHGEVIDPYHGLDDLTHGRLTVLHDASFSDDPTRLLRGIRLAGRHWLRFSDTTQALVSEAVRAGRLTTISGDRRRHELCLLLAEQQPVAGLAMARAYGLLDQIHPALVWDAWLAERLGRAPAAALGPPAVAARLALLAYRWPATTVEAFAAQLHLDRTLHHPLSALQRWHAQRPALLQATAGAAVAAALDTLPLATLTAAWLADDDDGIRRNIIWYLTDLHTRRPRLDGHALRTLGLPPGPIYRHLLGELRRAALNGELIDEAAEWDFLRDQVRRLDQSIVSPAHGHRMPHQSAGGGHADA